VAEMDPRNAEGRDQPGTFLTAEWRELAMLNYVVDPGLLHPFVPRGTELDCWQGKAFVSLVGFRFLKAKVFGVTFPFHGDFDEVNLRFYVRRKEGVEVRRGVVFIREIVPRRAIAAVARRFYQERYIALPMSHRIQPGGHDRVVEYSWKFRGGWNNLNLTTTGDSALPAEGSQEQFITEHYWGYAAQRDGGCVEYRVRHPQWRVSAGLGRFDGNMQELYGSELNAVLKNEPASVFLADGSRVSVHRGRRL
jgi:uncharacterized protein